MEEQKQEEVKLTVNELQDGSVTVDGIEDEAPEEQEQETQEAKAETTEDAVPEDGGQDHPDDTEAIRQARREKRKLKKQLARQNQQEKDLRFQQIQRQNEQLMERIAQLEHKTHGSELARIDKAIEDQQVRIQYAKMKIAEATKMQDGEALAEAQELWFEARRASEALENLKKQAATPQKQGDRPIAPDPSVQRMAAKWMEKNDWYDPQGGDEDSEIALMVDRRMAKEGWNPSDPDYWDELDSRLQKRLPHRYNEEHEEKPQVRRPRSVVTGGGRESAAAAGGKNSFTLSPDQVRAMKEAGFWDDPEMRNKMIRRYANENRKNRSA
jgi:hypothetical protein